MAIEQTLSIIKPDAVKKNVIGEIYSRFEKAGLAIIQAQMIELSTELKRRRRVSMRCIRNVLSLMTLSNL